jgi:hypothetical protein
MILLKIPRAPGQISRRTFVLGAFAEKKRENEKRLDFINAPQTLWSAGSVKSGGGLQFSLDQ